MSLTKTLSAHVLRNPIRYSVGGVLAATLAGLYLYRRYQQKQKQLGDLGGSTNKYGYAITEMNKLVKRQVEAATSHLPLSDFRQAEGSNKFYGTPGDEAGAYFRAAFWLAVAARCSQVWSLRDPADAQMRKGIAAQKRTFGMGGSARESVISSIMLSAGQAILAAAPKNPGAKAAAAALGSMGSPEQVAIKAQTVREQSAGGMIKGTYEASKKDVTDTATKAFDIIAMSSNAVRLLLGIDPPGDGPVDPWWNWKKWVLRGGVAVAVILGLRLWFAPQYHAAKAVVIRAGEAVNNPGAAIRSALTTAATGV